MNKKEYDKVNKILEETMAAIVEDPHYALGFLQVYMTQDDQWTAAAIDSIRKGLAK